MPTNNVYHPNFHKRSDKITEQPCCICGVPSGGWCITAKIELDRVAIQAHHPNHDPQNGKAKLIPLCEQCHLKIDRWYSSKKASYTMKGKKYDKMREAGYQELVFRFSAKGRDLDLASALLIVDNDWLTDKLIAYLKAEINKPKRPKKKPQAEQLQMFDEHDYLIIQVDLPISQFLQIEAS